MSKQNDILKESKREFEKLIQDKDAWIDHETLDTGKAWNFIETQIKKAVEEREKEIAEQLELFLEDEGIPDTTHAETLGEFLRKRDTVGLVFYLLQHRPQSRTKLSQQEK